MKKQLLVLRESFVALLSDDSINDSFRQNLLKAIILIDEILKKKWVKLGPIKVEVPTEITCKDLKYFLIQVINILMNLED